MSETERRGTGLVPDWSSDDLFTLNETAFRVGVFTARPSTRDLFVIGKPRWLLDEYIDLAPEFTGGRVVELGIAEGGSAAFLAHLLQPSMFLVLDIAEEPNAALADFIDTRGYDATLHTAYGVDQADRSRLEALLHQHFEDRPLDLVIDDASHVLGPTLTSFAVLFPRLRPGGVFILEDWSQALTWERVLRSNPEGLGQETTTRHIEKLARDGDLTQLVLQLTLVVGYAPEVVADIRVRNGFTMVQRGDATLDPDTFDLSACYGEIARSILSGSV